MAGQEMTSSSGCDVGTSSLINFLGGHLPSQRNRTEIAPDPVGGGHGAWDRALLAGVRVFQSSELLMPRQSGLSRCCDSPCQLRGDAKWHGEGSTGLKESQDCSVPTSPVLEMKTLLFGFKFSLYQ